MKPTKAYILRIDNPISIEYAKNCADSCDRVGMAWEYFDGYTNIDVFDAWTSTGIRFREDYLNSLSQHMGKIDNPQCCSAGHAAIWKLVAERNECAVILEHDALMLHNIEVDIPEDTITVLGYKTTTPEKYNHVKAGPPREVIPINGHEGAHAYAITPNTARRLIHEIETQGILGCVDNAYFLKSRNTRMKIAILSPTPAIGWLRKSTLWPKSATVNYTFIDSFASNYNA